MTRVSELFYNRRSRLNRAEASASSIGDLGMGYEYSGDRSLHFSNHHHHRRHHSHRHDLDGCDPLRRSPHLRHHRFVAHSERPPLTLDQSNRQSAPSNSTHAEPQRNISRPEFFASDRLPGSVLLARERLLERLRRVSLSGSRQSSIDASIIPQNDHSFDDNWRLADASDWGTVMSIQSPSAGSHLSNSTLSSERMISSSMKKPPGLSKEALDQLHAEIYSYSEKSCEHSVERKSQDCSICLESFLEGDKLICLPCEHRFHSGCLDPWVRTCGDCPYCRKGITFPAVLTETTHNSTAFP